MATMTTRAHPAIVPGPYRLLHGGDYNPEQWRHRPDVLAADPKLMRAANVNEASVGIFAWAALEPAQDGFDFAWLDGVMDRLHADGVGVILATPTGALPRWLGETFPDALTLLRDGRRNKPGEGRHSFCRTSPALRARVTIINAKLAERYAKHPALLGWHLNNEYGGAEDNSRCYCDGCLAGFRTWLKARYHGDLDALNRAWWTGFWAKTYTSWDQIRPGDSTIEALPLNWHRFTSTQVCDFFRHEIAAVRRHSDKPITTNWHGGLDHYDHGAMADDLDYASYDAYPDIDGSAKDRDNIHISAWQADTVRGLAAKAQGRPWLLMESCPGQPQYKPCVRAKRPGVHRLLSLLEVAHGADGVCYFQWRAGRGGMEKLHGAVLMQDAPHDTRIFRDVAALGRDLVNLSAVAGAATLADTAVIWDVESSWARGWNSGLHHLPKPQTQSQWWHRRLWELGHGVDVVDGTRDLTGYRLIIVPAVYLLRSGFAARLRAAAAHGAHILIDALSAWVDDDFGCVPGGRPGELRADLGLNVEELDHLRVDETVAISDSDWLPANTTVRGWIDRVHPAGCDVLATARGGFHDLWPVLTRKPVDSTANSGAFWYLAGDLAPAAGNHLIARLAHAAGLTPVLAHLPAGIIARERRQPDRRFIFLANLGETAATVPLPEGGFACAESGAAIAKDLSLAAGELRVITHAI
jgi:beta-galactosidase